MIFIHPTAEVSEKAKIGDGTKIWHHAQIRDALIDYLKLFYKSFNYSKNKKIYMEDENIIVVPTHR